MKMRRIVTLMSTVAISMATFVAAPPTSSAGSCMLETVALKTFDLTVKGKKKAYEVGDTAHIEVTVLRPSKEDPAGLGTYTEPPEQYPAENVNAGIGLRVGDVFLFGHGMTDKKGKAIVDIKLESWTPAGSALADAFAWNVVQDTPCLRVEENGYTQKPNVFKVIKPN